MANPDDVSFKIVRTQKRTYTTVLAVIAIENGYVIDGEIGARHYATPETLRQALLTIADRFVEEVQKHRTAAQEELP